MPKYKDKQRRVVIRGVSTRLWRIMLTFSEALHVPVGRLVNAAFLQFLISKHRIRPKEKEE